MSGTKLIVAALAVSLLVAAPANAESVSSAQLPARRRLDLLSVPHPSPTRSCAGTPLTGCRRCRPIRTGTRHTASCSSTWTRASVGRCT